MLIRIEGRDLPGRRVERFEGRERVVVGVQRRGRPGEVLDPQPWDAEQVSWVIEARVTGSDVTGPHVEGRPGERFVYLSWGTVGEGGFAMFRRAKLMLGEVAPDVLAAAQSAGTLTARLGLTDSCGGPRCARVVPPVISWSAG